MLYKVIHDFKDLEDNEHIYVVNDDYPRDGVRIEDIPKRRLKALMTCKNKIGEPLIKEIKIEEETTKE